LSCLLVDNGSVVGVSWLSSPNSISIIKAVTSRAIYAVRAFCAITAIMTILTVLAMVTIKKCFERSDCIQLASKKIKMCYIASSVLYERII